jgi:hypothetical protein
MSRERTLLEMREMVVSQQKSLRIDMSFDERRPALIEFEIDNHSDEGIPLRGWTWDDPNPDTRSESLEGAWDNFKRGLLP